MVLLWCSFCVHLGFPCIDLAFLIPSSCLYLFLSCLPFSFCVPLVFFSCFSCYFFVISFCLFLEFLYCSCCIPVIFFFLFFCWVSLGVLLFSSYLPPFSYFFSNFLCVFLRIPTFLKNSLCSTCLYYLFNLNFLNLSSLFTCFLLAWSWFSTCTSQVSFSSLSLPLSLVCLALFLILSFACLYLYSYHDPLVSICGPAFSSSYFYLPLVLINFAILVPFVVLRCPLAILIFFFTCAYLFFLLFYFSVILVLIIW